MGKIFADADRQLVAGGPAALSLREIARTLGISSSAMYRYVSSRDHLLTLMIERAFNELAAVVLASHDPGTSSELQLRALCYSVRAWALAHPQHYGLLYGTPVPGFKAPESTIEPGSKVLVLLAEILSTCGSQPQVSEKCARVIFREAGDWPFPPAVLAHTALVWSTLLGGISAEVFGSFGRGLADISDELFELLIERIVTSSQFD